MKRNGFTLVELLVAVAVIGVLSGIVIAALNPASFFARGRDGRRLSDLTTIQAALEQYYAQNGSYPASIPDAGEPWASGTITYLKSVPGDPSGGNYEYCVSGSDYGICATTEGTSPPSDCASAVAYGCTRNCCLTNPF